MVQLAEAAAADAAAAQRERERERERAAAEAASTPANADAARRPASAGESFGEQAGESTVGMAGEQQKQRGQGRGGRSKLGCAVLLACLPQGRNWIPLDSCCCLSFLTGHPSGADPSWLEEQLMQQCVELQRSGVQPTLPLLGSFCIEKLNLQMRVRLPAPPCPACPLTLVNGWPAR